MRLWRGFVRLLGAALCALGLHVPPGGLNAAMAISWVCVRCDAQVPGGLSARRKRRRHW